MVDGNGFCSLNAYAHMYICSSKQSMILCPWIMWQIQKNISLA